jgi:tetratricopeptide (TPR) repeat protein
LFALNLATMGRVDEAVEQLKLVITNAAPTRSGSGGGSASAPQAGTGRLYPANSEALQRLAELLISLGDLKGAREAYDGARELLESFSDGGPDHMRVGLRSLAEKLEQAGPA